MLTATGTLIALTLLAGGCAGAAHGPATAVPPSDGTALLRRMHDAYAGRWYRTLTFVQRTTRYAPDGAQQVSTWYEALRGDRLRIDFGDPSQGNGALYTPDSLYVVRAGKVARTVGEGNVFIPFIEGVYIQPVERTVAQIAPYHFDLSRVHAGSWEGRPTWIVGARDSADLLSPQFWVDAERLVVTRMLVPLLPRTDAAAAPHPQDIRLEGYEPVGSGWLATRVRMLDGDKPLQTEEYADWKGDVPLSADLFLAERWSAVPHWHAAPSN